MCISVCVCDKRGTEVNLIRPGVMERGKDRKKESKGCREERNSRRLEQDGWTD